LSITPSVHCGKEKKEEEVGGQGRGEEELKLGEQKEEKKGSGSKLFLRVIAARIPAKIPAPARFHPLTRSSC